MVGVAGYADTAKGVSVTSWLATCSLSMAQIGDPSMIFCVDEVSSLIVFLFSLTLRPL